MKVVDRFLNLEITDKPMLLEVFTETDDESNALEMVLNTIVDPKAVLKSKVKKVVKEVLPASAVQAIKNAVKR